MRKIINHTIIALAVFFITFSIAAYAQDNSPTEGQTQVSFGNDAQQLASRLAQQLGTTTGVADKITQILVDYRSNIASARQDFLDKNKGKNSGNQDVTGSQNSGTMTNIDSDPALMSDYSKADEQADKDIIDALDNDAQKAKYIQIKKQWWKDVKNSAYSSIKQMPGTDQDSGQETK